MNDPLLIHFQKQWKFLHTLTLDLLLVLSDAELDMSPGGGLGPWWKQFRHVGRVQENYLKAIESGTMNFGVEGASYTDGRSQSALHAYLQKLDRRLDDMLRDGLPRQTVDWFGEPKPVAQLLLYLADHELLHHGQWVVYRQLLGGSFPESWRIWGL